MCSSRLRHSHIAWYHFQCRNQSSLRLSMCFAVQREERHTKRRKPAQRWPEPSCRASQGMAWTSQQTACSLLHTLWRQLLCLQPVSLSHPMPMTWCALFTHHHTAIMFRTVFTALVHDVLSIFQGKVYQAVQNSLKRSGGCCFYREPPLSVHVHHERSLIGLFPCSWRRLRRQARRLVPFGRLHP